MKNNMGIDSATLVREAVSSQDFHQLDDATLISAVMRAEVHCVIFRVLAPPRTRVLNVCYRSWNARSRYRAGVVPTWRLKTRVKWLCSANPVTSAICDRGIVFARSSS